MKTLRRILSIVMIVMSISVFSVRANAQDIQYLGHVCYIMDEDKPSGTLIQRRMTVVSFIPGYYILLEGEFNGIAVVNTEMNAIGITLYGSYGVPGSSYGSPDQFRLPDTSVSHFIVRNMTVDALTLKGTHTDMTIQTLPGEQPTISTYSGSVSLSFCD